MRNLKKKIKYVACQSCRFISTDSFILDKAYCIDCYQQRLNTKRSPRIIEDIRKFISLPSEENKPKNK